MLRALRSTNWATAPLFPWRSYPSGHGAGPEIQWALPAQVRTLPIAFSARGGGTMVECSITNVNTSAQENGRHSPGRPIGRLAATAQACNPRTLCCEAFELLRLRPGPVQPSLGPKLARPAPSLQWAHQSNLGRTSAQHHPALEPDGANPFCTTAVPLRGWSNRAVPPRPGQ